MPIRTSYLVVLGRDGGHHPESDVSVEIAADHRDALRRHNRVVRGRIVAWFDRLYEVRQRLGVDADHRNSRGGTDRANPYYLPSSQHIGDTSPTQHTPSR